MALTKLFYRVHVLLVNQVISTVAHMSQALKSLLEDCTGELYSVFITAILGSI